MGCSSPTTWEITPLLDIYIPSSAKKDLLQTMFEDTQPSILFIFVDHSILGSPVTLLCPAEKACLPYVLPTAERMLLKLHALMSRMFTSQSFKVALRGVSRLNPKLRISIFAIDLGRNSLANLYQDRDMWAWTAHRALACAHATALRAVGPGTDCPRALTAHTGLAVGYLTTSEPEFEAKDVQRC